MNDASAQPPYTLAATIILMRERFDGPPELLMIERAASMAFAAGALVFPGGRVEASDWQIADALDCHRFTREETAQRIAAIRETIEEAGIAVGLDPLPDAATLMALRDGLAAGLSFDILLRQAGCRPAPEVLAPFARWRPVGEIARKFDTRFYLASAPSDAAEVADGTESVRAVWGTARNLLDDAEAGLHHVIFPTWCNLDRLAQFDSLEEAVADGARHAHHIASGRIERRDDMEWLCIDDGIGYPTTAQLFDKRLRG